MDADLDTLATALYVRVDDLLKISPDRAPARPLVGIAPRISDAEPARSGCHECPFAAPPQRIG